MTEKEEALEFAQERIPNWTQLHSEWQNYIVEIMLAWELREDGLADNLYNAVNIQVKHIDLEKMDQSDKDYVAYQVGDYLSKK